MRDAGGRQADPSGAGVETTDVSPAADDDGKQRAAKVEAALGGTGRDPEVGELEELETDTVEDLDVEADADEVAGRGPMAFTAFCNIR